jgi:hypothetical protein
MAAPFYKIIMENNSPQLGGASSNAASAVDWPQSVSIWLAGPDAGSPAIGVSLAGSSTTFSLLFFKGGPTIHRYVNLKGSNHFLTSFGTTDFNFTKKSMTLIFFIKKQRPAWLVGCYLLNLALAFALITGKARLRSLNSKMLQFFLILCTPLTNALSLSSLQKNRFHNS